VFCRFTGCNLWTGRERDRARAICQFCDTDFVGVDGLGGGRYRTPGALAEAILARWPANAGRPFIVFTGGEPTLQLDAVLIGELRAAGAELAIETNGTQLVPEGIDWICVSPKAGAPLRQRSGDELKIAWPQPGLSLAELERLSFRHRLLQPIDGPDYVANSAAVVEACRDRPVWQLSLQLAQADWHPMRWEITRTFRVEAAHLLPHVPEGHKCRRLHGHSFSIELQVGGDRLEPQGWVCDFADLADAWAPLHEQLDHRYLNEVEGLENPTSEHLAAWIWERVAPRLRGLRAVVVAETCTTKCVFRGS